MFYVSMTSAVADMNSTAVGGPHRVEDSASLTGAASIAGTSEASTDGTGTMSSAVTGEADGSLTTGTAGRPSVLVPTGYMWYCSIYCTSVVEYDTKCLTLTLIDTNCGL